MSVSDGGRLERPEQPVKPADVGVDQDRAYVPAANGDFAVRMAGVEAERRQAAGETEFRRSAGARGISPWSRVEAHRLRIGADVARRAAVQRRAAGAPGPASVPGPGAPLPSSVRRTMEPRLGADLSGVTVSTSSASSQAASALGARAFTVGSDIHFGSGEYAPGTKEGDRLLAHELTHVVQGRQAGVQRKAEAGAEAEAQAEQDGGQQARDPHEGGGAAGAEPAHEVSEPGEPAEQEADRVADAVADGIHGGAHNGAKDEHTAVAAGAGVEGASVADAQRPLRRRSPRCPAA